jgi:putative ABC transport system permease protein
MEPDREAFSFGSFGSFVTFGSFGSFGTFRSFGTFGSFIALLVLGAQATLSAQYQPPGILISRQLAASETLAVGSVVRLAIDAEGTGARAFRIVGIYEPTPDPAQLGVVPREVRLHLPDLLDVTRPPGFPAGTEYISSINVKLTDPADATAFSRDVNARMPGVVARPSSEAAGSAGPFRVLERFHLAIAIVTIVAATVFLLALTIMLVDERRETVGVLRLIGLPARRILVQVLIEGVLVAGAGAVFGLLLALLSQELINLFFQWRYDTALVFVKVTKDVALTSVAIAVPLGASATVVASWALLRRSGLRLARRGMRSGLRGGASCDSQRVPRLACSAWPPWARFCSTCSFSRKDCSSRCAICSTDRDGTFAWPPAIFQDAGRASRTRRTRLAASRSCHRSDRR